MIPTITLPQETAPPPTHSSVLISPSQLQALPVPPDLVLAAATTDTVAVPWDAGDIGGSVSLAAALMWARTGDPNYRARVQTLLANLAQTTQQPIPRKLPGYFLAADLIDAAPPTFHTWATQWIEPLKAMHQSSVGLPGIEAGTALIAACRYLGGAFDEVEIQFAWQVFRTYVGDSAPLFAYPDAAWQEYPDCWQAERPLYFGIQRGDASVLGCSGALLNADGAIAPFMPCSSIACADDPAKSVEWRNALDQLALSAVILGRSKIDVGPVRPAWTVGGSALRRAGIFMQATQIPGWGAHAINGTLAGEGARVATELGANGIGPYFFGWLASGDTGWPLLPE